MVSYRILPWSLKSGAAALLLALPCLVTMGCGSADKASKSDLEAERLAEALAQGPALYAENRCAECHGHDREGSELAPALRKLDEVWNEENLTRFLMDPRDSMARHPGVDGLQTTYPDDMPGLGPGTPESEARLLALFLIHQS